MNPEERKMLEETLELTEENNKILRGLRSAARWGRFFRAIYWLIIIAGTIGAYVYVQPMVSGLLRTYQEMAAGLRQAEKVGKSISGGLNAAPDILNQFQKILDQGQ